VQKMVEKLELRLEDEDYKLTVFINDINWEILREPHPQVRREDFMVAEKVSGIIEPYNAAIESMFKEIDLAVAEFKQKLRTLLEGETGEAFKE